MSHAPVSYARKNIGLHHVLRDTADPFTSLAFQFARGLNIRPQDLSDLSLSYFCQRASEYTQSQPGEGGGHARLPRHKLAAALLTRSMDDLLSDQCKELPEWIFFNAIKLPPQELVDGGAWSDKAVVPQVREIYQDYLWSPLAAHRGVVPQSDLNLVTTMKRLPAGGIMEPPDYVKDGIEARFVSKGTRVPGFDKNRYRVEFFRQDHCAEMSFLNARSFSPKISSTPSVDANFGGVLTYDGMYCSLFSGMPLDDGVTFLVMQLQGAAIDRSTRRDVGAEEFRLKNPHITQVPLKFTLMLAIEYARAHSFSKIALVPGALNHSALGHEARGDMDRESHVFNTAMAKRIYDGVARQLKFTLFDPRLGGYHSLDLGV